MPKDNRRKKEKGQSSDLIDEDEQKKIVATFEQQNTGNMNKFVKSTKVFTFVISILYIILGFVDISFDIGGDQVNNNKNTQRILLTLWVSSLSFASSCVSLILDKDKGKVFKWISISMSFGLMGYWCYFYNEIRDSFGSLVFIPFIPFIVISLIFYGLSELERAKTEIEELKTLMYKYKNA